MNESDLIAAVRDGSTEQYAQLVSQHQSAVRAYVGAYVRRADVVDDLSQEVFLAAYRAIATHNAAESSFRIWILGIARHKVLNYLRDEARRRARHDSLLNAELRRLRVADLESDSSDPEHVESQMRTLRRCLDKLPGKSRQMIDAFYFKSSNAEQIAVDQNTTGNAVRVALARIRRALRDCASQRMNVEGAQG